MPRVRPIFPGYAVAAASTLALFATAPGQTFIVSLLNRESVLSELGISKLTFNSAYTVATMMAAAPLVLTGTLADRLGPRRAMALVGLAFGAGCLVMASAVGLLSAFLGFFCLRFLGMGSLSLVSSHALAMWFHRRLGSINGLKIVTVFALWAFLPQLTLRLMGEIGWRGAYGVFAVAVVLLVVPAALLLVRDRPEDLGLRTDNDPADPPEPGSGPVRRAEANFTLRQARRTRAYWILALTSVLPGFIGTALLFDVIPISAEKGLTEAHAAAAVSAWTLTMSISALPAGFVIDRMHPAIVIASSMLASAVSTAAIAMATSPLQLGAAMVALGLSQSFGSGCAAATTARYFGRLHHGAIRSSLTRFSVVGTGLGPIATAGSYELTGGYVPAVWGFALVSLCAAGVTGLLREPPTPRDA